MGRTLRLGTRGSALARAQTELVLAALRRAIPDISVEVVTVATRGDLDQTSPVREGSGWFTTALQEALREGRVDLAIHSYKDLPTARPEGLVIAAVPLREDPRDALVSYSGQPLRALPAGARIGTGSPRRAVQLTAIRPDVEVVPMRGNVDTRIRKVRAGEVDAAVLALAGLRRLGLEKEAAQVFGPEEMLPAPAQGALAVECRADDDEALAAARAIDDPVLRATVGAERAFLARLEAGCSFPAAAYAEVFGSTLKLHGLIAAEGKIIRSKVGGPIEAWAGLGRQLADELLAKAKRR
ncbi:Porphobilinogen deaminase [bacterium HR29]|jgi:hydroxymethylbilane synthase|nr:Porphobilinogen deaminase [bacterium HR29]